jgi:N-acetylated-alpha-linked acidic dipeptidase
MVFPHRTCAKHALYCAAAAILAAPAPLSGQEALPGYSPAAATAQSAAERAAIAAPSAERARAHSQALTREPHIAGTPAQARTRDYVIDAMRRMGLRTEVREYEIWLPHFTAVQLWRIAPDTLALPLAEPALMQDSISWLHTRPVMANGYSGTGDVSAPLIYANYGLIEDYAKLDSMGIAVQGAIVIARYGRSFRGIKAREAERRGAVGLILYSDPQEDGYVRGAVYPDGPMRPAWGVQYGSVMNMIGDPSTPGYPSRPGARRIPLDSMNVPRIPVIPIGYGNAQELLRLLEGAEVPGGWQGGLPFRYRVGPGPVQARMVVRTDTATAPLKKIWNTYGIIEGSELPNEMILIGAHRDAWGPGAVDNVSGTVSVLEAAHAIAEQLRAGQRPRRTLVFATWDAEEWGIIGSAEYVEDDAQRLLRGAVAYLNQDGMASGIAFGGGGSPSLRSTLRHVARQVPDPGGDGSVYDVWRARTNPADGAEPPMGDPGGGSDFAGFYNHLGIPHADWGFGGPSGIYHSGYDSFDWMERFGDRDFTRHAAAARIGAAMLLRLANADVLPYDYVEFGRTMRAHANGIREQLRQREWDLSTGALDDSIARFESAAVAFERTRDSLLARGAPPRRVRDATNAALLRVERSLTRYGGLRSRPWFRNVIYASDMDNGYSTMPLPTVGEAIRSGDRELTVRELADLAARFGAASRALDDARSALARRR